MTRKKFDFNKPVKVCVMKVYTVRNILMQVMSVKNDLDLASILHISLLCDKSSLLYQNGSLVTLETNKCHWLNSSLFAIILLFTFTYIFPDPQKLACELRCFFFVTASKTASFFFTLDAGTQLCIS